MGEFQWDKLEGIEMRLEKYKMKCLCCELEGGCNANYLNSFDDAPTKDYQICGECHHDIFNMGQEPMPKVDEYLKKTVGKYWREDMVLYCWEHKKSPEEKGSCNCLNRCFDKYGDGDDGFDEFEKRNDEWRDYREQLEDGLYPTNSIAEPPHIIEESK